MINIFGRQVALFIDDQYFCGGSLISADWVLTAARNIFLTSEIINVIKICNIIFDCSKTALTTLRSLMFYLVLIMSALMRRMSQNVLSTDQRFTRFIQTGDQLFFVTTWP